MAEFFDKKEEVLDIQLTQHGKYLLSRGEFDPKFYAFFDDDIIYDTEYAGFIETQNAGEKKMQKEYKSPQTGIWFLNAPLAILNLILQTLHHGKLIF